VGAYALPLSVHASSSQAPPEPPLTPGSRSLFVQKPGAHQVEGMVYNKTS